MEYKKLVEAKEKASNLLAQKVNEKKNLTSMLAAKQSEIYSVEERFKVLKKNAIFVLLSFVAFIFTIFITFESDGDLVIFLIAALVIFAVFSAKMHRADGKSGWRAAINYFTYGLFSTISAIIILCKSKQTEVNNIYQSIGIVNRRLASVEDDINRARESLRQLNEKINDFRNNEEQL